MNKKLLLATAGLMLSSSLANAETFIAKVKKAQLYLNSAEITKTFEAQLTKGRYQYEIQNFEKNEKPELFITGAKLLSHSSSEKNLDKLNQELEALLFKQSLVKEEIAYYQKLGSHLSQSLEKIAQSTEDILERSNKIINKINELKNQELQIAKEISELEKKIKAENNQVSQKVDFVVENDGKVSIDFKSKTNKAYWRPKAEINLDVEKNALELTASAEIIQNSEADWENVELSLAIVPPKTAEIPEFREQQLVLREDVVNTAGRARMSADAAAPMMMAKAVAMEDTAYEAAENYEPEVINVGGNFLINLPSTYNLKAKEKSNVSYFAQEVKADIFSALYQWADSKVILAVKFNLPIALLPQEISLKRNGLLIKQYQNYDFLASGSEQTLAFGEDNSFSVEKISVPDMNETKGFIGKEKIRNVEEKFIISANEDTKPLKIYARVPSSTNEAIIVERKFDKKPDQEGVKGRKSFLVWNLNAMKKGEKSEFKFAYSIRYPQNKRIIYR